VPLPGQPEIADRNQPPAGAIAGTIAVREGVKLLDISKRMMGLALDPGSYADLQRPMARLERAGGQRFGIVVSVMDRKHARLVRGDGHDDRRQFDRHGVRVGLHRVIVLLNSRCGR
jgi:hypothetical protein